MKTKTLLATMFAAVFCAQMAAQPFQRESFPEGSYSPVTNINRNGYPQVLKDGSVMFRVQAPQAQQVQMTSRCRMWRKSLHEFAQYLFK